MKRVCDFKVSNEQSVDAEVRYYTSIERPAYDDILAKLYSHQFIKMDAAGLTDE